MNKKNDELNELNVSPKVVRPTLGPYQADAIQQNAFALNISFVVNIGSRQRRQRKRRKWFI